MSITRERQDPEHLYHRTRAHRRKGARLPPSGQPLLPAAQPFVYGEFELFAGRDKYTVNQCAIAESFFPIREDTRALPSARRCFSSPTRPCRSASRTGRCSCCCTMRSLSSPMASRTRSTCSSAICCAISTPSATALPSRPARAAGATCARDAHVYASAQGGGRGLRRLRVRRARDWQDRAGGHAPHAAAAGYGAGPRVPDGGAARRTQAVFDGPRVPFARLCCKNSCIFRDVPLKICAFNRKSR